jgi:DNA polymerase elongation subunit (family B)
MSEIRFHILDSYIQDLEIENETDTTQEVRYVDDEFSDTQDAEVYSRRKRGKSATYSSKKRSIVIHIFGTLANGDSAHLSVYGFEPFFYVKMPNHLTEVQETFSKYLKARIYQQNDWVLKRSESYTVSFERRQVLMGFTGGREYTFAKLSVNSLQAWRNIKSYFLDKENKFIFQLYSGSSALEVFEANLDPMLRFFHLRNIKPCGWIHFGVEDFDEDSHSYTVHWEDVHPESSPVIPCAPFLHAYWDIECFSESGDFPLPKKGYDSVVKLLMEHARDGDDAVDLILQSTLYPENPPTGMFPIRTIRKIPKRDIFESELRRPELIESLSNAILNKSHEEMMQALKPLARKFPLSGDPIIQIGVVLERGSSTVAPFHERHIFVVGACGPVENAVVHAYTTEKGMLQAWATTMVQWNPDVLLGYNTFGFDERYLWGRCEELEIHQSEAFQNLSRLHEAGKNVELNEKFLSSSALGDNTLYMLSMYGRLSVDLYQYIKRSFTLASYKLDDVCQHFMSGSLIDVDCGSEVWHLNTKSTSDVMPGRYVVLLDETGDCVIDKLKVIEVVPKVRVVVEAPSDPDLALAVNQAVKWAVVKDDVSPQELFRLHKGSAEDRAKIASYCIQDCILVRDLYKKLDVFNNAMAMANACSVPIPYIFTRGQGVKIESLIFKECYERRQCVKVLPTTVYGSAAATNDDSYEGAIVLEPNPGIYYDSPIGVADFASLYPSTIISENISFDTLVSVKDYDLNGKFKGFVLGSDVDAPADVQWTDISFDVWGTDPSDKRKNPAKIKQGLRVCRYAQYDSGLKGTLPQIVQKLLATRKEKRKEAANESDPFKKALLDAEQLAYKLTANSLYGQLGSATFKIRLQHLAASVTAYGRKQIIFAKAAIERFYGPEAGDPRCSAEIVYGDTDSLFVNFNPVGADGKRLEGKEAIEATMHLTEEAGKFVTRVLKAPHDFEYDKVFYPFIIFSKKRYVGNKYEESSDSYYQNSMGIATKRRDYAPLVKVIYGGALQILLTERSVKAAHEFVQEKLLELVEGKMSLNLLTMSKSLRAEYKTATPPAHKVLADRMRLRDEGTAPASGERVPFIYILPPTGQVASKLQGERVEHPTYIKEKGLKPDFKFYIEHQLMNPIVQLFALVAEQIPGVKVPKGGWAEGDREVATTKAIFQNILAMCDRAALRRFGNEFFGTSVTETSVTETSVAPRRMSGRIAAAEAKKSTQSTLNSFFADKMLLKKLESSKRVA